MPKNIPIRDLKNTGEISQMRRESSGPIYITKIWL
jgi:ribosomal protein S25